MEEEAQTRRRSLIIKDAKVVEPVAHYAISLPPNGLGVEPPGDLASPFAKSALAWGPSAHSPGGASLWRASGSPSQTASSRCRTAGLATPLVVPAATQILVHGRGLAGLQENGSKLLPGKKVGDRDLSESLAYHGVCWVKAVDFPEPAHAAAAWLVARDGETGAKARALHAEGYPWCEALRIAGETDRIYEDAPSEVVLKVGTGAGVQIQNENWSDCVVWNPWTSMEACYKEFVCVENAKTAQKVRVGPNESWRARADFAVVDLI